MSKQQAKDIFKDSVTTWEEKTMHEYTDIVYGDIEKAKDYVVDSGSNSNGSWEKWASGKLVQWGTDVNSVQPTSIVSGIAYNNGHVVKFPITFITEPSYVGVNVIREAGLIWSDLFSKSTSEFQAMVAGVSENARGRIVFMAVGRWK